MDTNVLVSGLLKTDSPPAQLVRLIAAGKLRIAYDPRLLDEYRRVLSRRKFGIDSAALRAFLGAIEADGQCVVAQPLNLVLPDPNDLMFVEVAHTAGADVLVTGNVRHFPSSHLGSFAFSVRAPAAYLRNLRAVWGT